MNSIETFIKIIDQNLYLFNSKKSSALLTKQRESLIKLFEKIISLFDTFLMKKQDRVNNKHIITINLYYIY